MGALPPELRTQIERRLFNRANAVRSAEAYLQKCRVDAYAVKVSAPSIDVPDANADGVNPAAIRSTGGTHDAVAMAAMSVVSAEKRLDDARSWAAAMDAADDYFGADDIRVKIIRDHYSSMMQDAQISALLGVDRQTVRRYRDEYITILAIIAAEKGLISIGAPG